MTTRRTCSRQHRRVLLVAAMVVVIAAAVAAVRVPAASAAWSCGTYSGTSVQYCSWGYNYVNSGTGEPQSPYKYYYEQDLYKNSGGTVQTGVGPVDGCDMNKTGSGTWYVIIQNVWGCTGNMFNYLIYEDGAQSYLQLVGSTAP